MDWRIDRDGSPADRKDDASKQGANPGVFKALTPREFLTLADQEVRRASRYTRPLSALMIHMNEVPTMIESDGPDAASKVVLAVIDRVQQMMRDTDLMSHLGPSELGLLLPETRLEQAYIAALRLRMAFDDNALETPVGSRVLSLCVGVAAISPRTKSAKTFLMQACVELRRARAEGPGSVCAAAPDTSRVIRAGSRSIH